tara:strand:- start:4768 stop:5181 length:414 start_codon:yes stop_codon:yes gene_type:complete
MKIHHIGFVVNDIKTSIKNFKKLYSLNYVTEIFEDTIQQVNVAFIYNNPSETQIELIEPTNKKSPVYEFLKKGGGLHHICYETKNILKTIEHLKLDKNIRSIVPPVPGGGHNNKLISFFYVNRDCPKGHIVELVEVN